MHTVIMPLQPSTINPEFKRALVISQFLTTIAHIIMFSPFSDYTLQAAATAM